MTVRSGSGKELRAAAEFALVDTFYECTNTIEMGRGANSLRLYVASTIDNPGDIEFYIQHSLNGSAGTFYDYCSSGEGPEIWGKLPFTDKDQFKSFEIDGLNLYPGETLKVWFRASANAGASGAQVAITGITFDSTVGGVDIATGDIEIAMEIVDDWDGTEDVALGAGHDGCVALNRFADFDGSALPTRGDTEGDAVIPAVSGQGVRYNAIVNEDGSTMLPTGDTVARAIHSAIGDGTTTAVVETAGAKKAVNVNVTDGTNDQPTMDANTRAGFQKITDGTNEVAVLPTILAAKTDTSSIAGTATDVNAGNVGAGSQRVTIATDDINQAAINLSTTDIPNVIGTDGAAGPTKAVSIAGTDGAGALQEVKTDTDGELQVDVLTLPGDLVGHAEDGAHTTGDVGIEALAVRNDALASLCDTDGDYTPLQVDADGALFTDIAKQSLTALKVSKDAAANATANRIFVKSDTDLLGGNAINVNGGNKDTGTQTVTLADDDKAVTALEILDDSIGTHDEAADTKGIKLMGYARDAEMTDVSDNGDNARIVVGHNGQIVIEGYVWADNDNRVKETASLDTKVSPVSLVDTTDIAAATHYYPGATGKAMLPYKDLSLTGKLIDADGTLTLTVEAMDDEDTTGGDWIDITKSGYKPDDNTTGNASITITNGTEKYAICFDEFNFDYYRIKIVASGATNTVICKERRKAL